MHRLPVPGLTLALVALLALTACSRRETAPADTAAPAATTPAAELRLGYFPNITHAPALIGVANGYFQQELGSTTLTTQTFNAGPDAVNALLGGSLDAQFIGSSPAINAFAKSNGDAVRLVAGRPRAAPSSSSPPASPRPSSSRARSSRPRRPATPRTSRSRSGSRSTTSRSAPGRTR